MRRSGKGMLGLMPRRPKGADSMEPLVVRLSDSVIITLADCRDVLPVQCDAVVTDPPYNIGKAAWDKIPDYLQWCESWIAAASKGCKRQGAFWCFHSEPLVLADIARIIGRHGKPMQNWVTWDKYNGNPTKQCGGGPMVGMTQIASLRKFQDFAEYITYHADDGQWERQSADLWSGKAGNRNFGQERGFIFEPLRAYLDNERQRAGVTRQQIQEATGTQMEGHWFGRSQWQLPTPEHYATLQRLFNAQGGDYLRREYDDLRREYDDLRQEYEHLRPTFHNPGKVSSVWQYPPAPSNGHETPKPVELMQRIVETTTNPGDTVLDCFAGSGTTGIACIRTGRKFVGIEKDARYFEIARQRLERELAQGLLPLTHNMETTATP